MKKKGPFVKVTPLTIRTSDQLRKSTYSHVLDGFESDLFLLLDALSRFREDWLEEKNRSTSLYQRKATIGKPNNKGVFTIK